MKGSLLNLPSQDFSVHVRDCLILLLQTFNKHIMKALFRQRQWRIRRLYVFWTHSFSPSSFSNHCFSPDSTLILQYPTLLCELHLHPGTSRYLLDSFQIKSYHGRIWQSPRSLASNNFLSLWSLRVTSNTLSFLFLHLCPSA